jgi:hypothetical protein
MSISSTRRVLVFGLLLAILLLVSGGIAIAQQGSVDVRGEPDFEVYVPDNTVSPGSEPEVTLQLVNDGEVTHGKETDREYVTTARNVIVEAEADDDDSPITVTSGARSAGSVSEQQPTDVPIRLEIPDSAEPGTYDLEVTLEYSWTERVREGVDGQIDLRNPRSRTVTRDVEIEVDDGARFQVVNVSSDLRVGEEGAITGEVVNTGDEDATNAEVQFPTEHENLIPQETSVAIGDVPAGESAAFRIPIEVGTEAEAVRKRFDLPVSFRNANGVRTTDDSPELLADIGPERDAFTIGSTNRSITAGSSTTAEFTITNNRDETVTDIEPKLFTDTPFSSSNDEAFVESLAPGESTTISFDIAAAGSATPKIYPVTLDVRYRDGAGNSQITDSYRVPVAVAQAEEGGILGSLGTIVVGAISILAIGGGYVWYRDQ